MLLSKCHEPALESIDEQVMGPSTPLSSQEAPSKNTSYEHTKKEAVSIEEESSNDTTVFDVDHVEESGHHSGKAEAPQAEPEKQPVQLPEPGKPKTQKRDRPQKNATKTVDPAGDWVFNSRLGGCVRRSTRISSKQPPRQSLRLAALPQINYKLYCC
jgi:hypothetical protein